MGKQQQKKKKKKKKNKKNKKNKKKKNCDFNLKSALRSFKQLIVIIFIPIYFIQRFIFLFYLFILMMQLKKKKKKKKNLLTKNDTFSYSLTIPNNFLT